MGSEAKAVWNECLRVIEKHVNEQSFSTWFKPINPVRIEGSVLTIQVQNQFFYEWIEDNYIQVLKLAIKSVMGANGKLEYAVVVDKGNSQNQRYVVGFPQGNNPGSYSQKKELKGEQNNNRSPFDMQSLHSDALLQSNLNPNYSFSSDIEGDCNRLARSAGVAVATKTGIS